MSEEIEEFERTLHKLGVSGGEDDLAETYKSFHSIAPSTHLQVMKKKLDVDKMKSKSKDYFEKVKEKRKIEKEARKERDERRRKVLVDQQRLLQEIHEQKRQQHMIDTLLQLSIEEQSLAQKVMESRRWKAIITENRRLRERRYDERRRLDEEEIRRREEEALRQEIEQKQLQGQQHLMVYEEKLKKISKAKHEECCQFCTEVFNDLTNLCFRYVEYQRTSEAPLPTTEWDEWKSVFVQQGSDNYSDGDTKLEQLLNHKDMKAYLGNQKTNNHLLSIIQDVFHKTNPPPERPSPFISKYPLRIMVVGLPMSGKTSLCKQLAEKFALHHISPEFLVKRECENIERHSLVQEQIVCGQSIPRSFLKDLIRQEIQQIEDQGNSSLKGWILDSFPDNVDISMEIDKILTGQDTVAQPAKQLSVFLPSDETYKISSNPEKTAFSLILSLNPPKTSIIDRISSLRIDPDTGDVYDFEKMPPNDPDVKRRMEPLDENRFNLARIPDRMIAFQDEFNKLKSTYSSIVTILDWQNENFDGIIAEVEKLLAKKSSDSTLKSTNTGETNTSSVDRPVLDISIEEAELLKKAWSTFEELFTKHLQEIFAEARNLRLQMKAHFQKIKQQFLSVVRRPDKKQQLVDKFCEQFNHIDRDLRVKIEIKHDLHKKTDELRNQLWSICDKRKEEELKEIEALESSPWVESHRNLIFKLFVDLLQLELDRFAHTVRFVEDYYAEKFDIYNSEKYEEPEGDLLQWNLWEAEDAKKKGKKKGKKSKTADRPTEPLELFNFMANQAKSWVAEAEFRKADGATYEDRYQTALQQFVDTEIELFHDRVDNIAKMLQDSFELVQNTSMSYWEAFHRFVKDSYEQQLRVVSTAITSIQDKIEIEEPLDDGLKIGNDFIMFEVSESLST